MTPEQAFDLLDQVSSRFHGTRQDHVNLVQALEVIKGLIPKPEVKKAEKPEKPEKKEGNKS